MRVHPVADLFPMMSEDELADLAADIKENGQIHPIVVADIDGEETLIDGRNRMRACEIAEVEPRKEALNGQDPVAYILSTNVARRHMTKGALAMLVAEAYPDPDERGRGKKSAATAAFPMVADRRLREARMVKRWASDKVAVVIAGTESLDSAYKVAVERKQAADSTEAKMDRLRKAAPDLADLVTEERMKVDEAIAAQMERDRQIQQIIEHGREAATGGMSEFIANVAAIAAAVQAGATDILDDERLHEVVKAANSLKRLFA